MNELVKDFVSSYGSQIIYTALAALVSYVGIAIKNLYERYITDNTKRKVIRECVKAVEQVYKALDGPEKLNKATEYAVSILNSKGIEITELEVRVLIEAFVGDLHDTLGEEEEEDVEKVISDIINSLNIAEVRG